MAAYNSQTQYTRRLDDFRGVDLSSGQTQVSPKRFAYAQNMWRDYGAELGGAIETMPGFRALCLFSGTIHGIWTFRPFEGETHVMVHAGTSLYMFRHADRDRIADDPTLITEYTGLADSKSTAFVFNGIFYILDGKSFRVLKPKGEGFELASTENTAYVPVTYVNGEMYEQRNMLIDRTINRETQAPEYDASALYTYEETGGQGSLTIGDITGFANRHKSDAVIILKNLRGTTGALDKPIDDISGIAEGAFESNDTIKHVMIFREPGAVNSEWTIRARAFYGSSALRNVELYRGAIMGEAFANCKELREVDLNACGFATGAFANCPNIDTIKLAGIDSVVADLFTECHPREIWLGNVHGFTMPEKIPNEGYYEGEPFMFPYLETANPDFDESAAVTLDNFPYLLAPNPDYDGAASAEYKIKSRGTTYVLMHYVDYAVLLNSTRTYIDDNGDEMEEDIDWTDPAEYNRLPFKIESYGGGKYRAQPVYQVESSFGHLDRLKRVHTAYSASELSDDDLADFRAALDALYSAGVEIVYESPTHSALNKVDGTAEGEYTSDTMAREAVVYDPADSVDHIEVDGEELDKYGVVYVNIDDEWHVERVILTESATDDEELTDYDIDIFLNCKPGKFTTAKGYLDFASANTEYKGTTVDAIIKCRISATFDDRIFLTGNPALPNTVFYCRRDNTGYPNPAYWGVLNYVNDGVGQSPNVAMLATAGMLMVLKGNDPHDATAYYHTGVDSGNDVIPRLYPSERGLAGIGCTGIAVNFRDDAVFMSNAGLEAVGKQQVNLERSLAHRSSLVDRMMVHEDLARSVSAEWNGYLMIFTPSGNVYMADSRQMHQNGENYEYEWYLLSGVGIYEGQREDYVQITGDVILYDETGLHWMSEEHSEAYAVIGNKRYPIELPPNDPQYIEPDAVWDSHVYKHATGSDVWHDAQGAELRADVALFDGKAFIVSPSGRFSGGEFKPVTAAADVESVLYFGTQNGAVCCFNTDKRNVAVDGEQPADGTIHRSYYTYNGRQIDSFITTAYDHAGFPDLAKKTVKKSLVAHVKTFPGSRIEVRVRTNRNDEWRQVNTKKHRDFNWDSVGQVSTATYDFYSLDYISAPLQLAEETLSVVREKEKKWALKQLYFGSVGFKCPWGIYSAGYRFTVTGRIKI